MATLPLYCATDVHLVFIFMQPLTVIKSYAVFMSKIDRIIDRLLIVLILSDLYHQKLTNII